MRELNLFDACVNLKPIGEHAQGTVRHLIVAHVEDLQVALRHQALLEGLNLRVSQLVAHQIQLPDRHDDKKV